MCIYISYIPIYICIYSICIYVYTHGNPLHLRHSRVTLDSNRSEVFTAGHTLDSITSEIPPQPPP